MTKEEIRKVLDLALEYYKLEIFGTGKESQPPTQERIDYIYERVQPSIPSNLDEAAKDYLKQYNESGFGNGGDDWDDDILITFKSGAEWMAGQGVISEGKVFTSAFTSYVKTPGIEKLLKEAFPKDTEVIVQIRKK